jgi:hypothetical protein
VTTWRLGIRIGDGFQVSRVMLTQVGATHGDSMEALSHVCCCYIKGGAIVARGEAVCDVFVFLHFL